MKYVLSSNARDDLRAAAEFYESQCEGLGSEFAVELGIALAQVMDGPDRWPVELPSVHRFRLNRFPYGVFYKHDIPARTVRVIAILDLRRDPDSFVRRAKE